MVKKQKGRPPQGKRDYYRQRPLYASQRFQEPYRQMSNLTGIPLKTLVERALDIALTELAIEVAAEVEAKSSAVLLIAKEARESDEDAG